ncbi:sulfate adenylyltransferase subunit CysD [Rhizobium brockwellii]|uniref:sulfate adenylyltransferase subunit CysD n=1 Tax=Rhizobium brockwellii TaxID=3019932 RepID=UPI003F9C39DE
MENKQHLEKPGVHSDLRLTSGVIRYLEDESLHIIREALSEARKPVVLFSLGKDSCVLIHLIRKALYPERPNLPLLHIDTRWKFREMYNFRQRVVDQGHWEVLTYTNPEALERDIGPFKHSPEAHTSITKVEGLKKALDLHGFDVIFGGARRDEEVSRSKERIFSVRSDNHRWDPRRQRPELWTVYNTRIRSGETLRVFPLSNWTEIDVWHYILHEKIEIVPLYFSESRPVVTRDGLLIVVDDDRFEFKQGEAVTYENVRFRTLGCYPLTAAVKSNAKTVESIILELEHSRSFERSGRLIDSSSHGMEAKKIEGYF